LYVFRQTLSFATIPKTCGFGAATRFTSILLGGSLIPIGIIGMGMALPRLNTYPAFAGMTVQRKNSFQ